MDATTPAPPMGHPSRRRPSNGSSGSRHNLGRSPSSVRSKVSGAFSAVEHPKRALVLFGMQQDFFDDLSLGSSGRASPVNPHANTTAPMPTLHESVRRAGKLPVPEAKHVAEKVSMLLNMSFDAVFWCKTCHPVHHCSFFENNPGSTMGTFELIKKLGKANRRASTASVRGTGMLKKQDVAARSPQTQSHEEMKNDSGAPLLPPLDEAPLQTPSQRERVRRGETTKIMQQVVRPTHCVEGTRGSQFHPEVRPSPWDRVIKSCTEVQSKSPGLPKTLLRELTRVGALEEIYFAGIGISPFVDGGAARLHRRMPAVKIFALEDICCVLNVAETGEVLRTDPSALATMLRRARIRPMQSSALINMLPPRDMSEMSDLSWHKFIDVLGYRLSMIADLEQFGDTQASMAKRRVLLELLNNRDLHMHNAMPPVEWLDQAGLWD